MRNLARFLWVFPALALGCGTDLVSPRDASSPELAESFPCNLRVPDLARQDAGTTWSAWVYADRYGIPVGCGARNQRDGIARFTPPTAGRWIFQASGPDLAALSLRAVCEDASSTRACRDRPTGPRAFSWELRAGEPVLLVASGCASEGRTCAWRLDATPAPPTGPSCADGRACAPSEVCQRLLDDPAEEPLCVTAEAPRITAAVMEVGLGRSRFEVTVEDENRDATTVTLSVLDADGAEVAAPSSGLLGTHALTGTGVRRSASSPYLLTADYGRATHARFVAHDASGRSSTRVVPLTPVRYRREQESCLDGALCTPGLCCWYHYSAAICMRDCSR